MYQANESRYDSMQYRRCGTDSGLKLSAVSLGMWHNFGSVDDFENARAMARTAFDAGITNFDLANNYGPEPGSAETTFGKILADDFKPYRDQITVSSKAGYLMWPGPFGDGGSRKYLIASCDASLKRLGLDYVDIFYHHRPDPETPVEESMLALAQIVRSGRAIYAGISNYPPEAAIKALNILREERIPCVLDQVPFNILDRRYEDNGLLPLLAEQGIGGIIFSPLAQGVLTDRYRNGVPDDSRAARNDVFFHDAAPEVKSWVFNSSKVTPKLIETTAKLRDIAEKRGQTLAQMAIAWVLSRPGVTSALIGASRPAHITDIVQCLGDTSFSPLENELIDAIYDNWKTAN